MTEPCAECGTPFAVQLHACTHCGHAGDAPVVKIARGERVQLMDRAATAEAIGGAALAARIEAVAARSHAVLNTNPKFADQWVSTRVVFLTYARQVAAGVRPPSRLPDDQDRVGSEGLLYGSAAGSFVYAALSADARGLWSYGDVALFLRDDSIRRRAAVLEENAFDFCERHGVTVRRRPRGYLAVWADRPRLAVAKLAARLPPDADEARVAAELLVPGRTRADDAFMEVHIDGNLAGSTVAQYALTPAHPRDAEDQYLRDRFVQTALSRGITASSPP